MSTEYEARVSQMTVVQRGEPLFSESAMEVSIVDEASGEFIEVKDQQTEGCIQLDPSVWPTLRRTIDDMFALIAAREKAGEAS